MILIISDLFLFQILGNTIHGHIIERGYALQASSLLSYDSIRYNNIILYFKYHSTMQSLKKISLKQFLSSFQ